MASGRAAKSMYLLTSLGLQVTGRMYFITRRSLHRISTYWDLSASGTLLVLWFLYFFTESTHPCGIVHLSCSGVMKSLIKNHHRKKKQAYNTCSLASSTKKDWNVVIYSVPMALMWSWDISYTPCTLYINSSPGSSSASYPCYAIKNSENQYGIYFHHPHVIHQQTYLCH